MQRHRSYACQGTNDYGMKAYFISALAALLLLACSKKEAKVHDSGALFGDWKEYEAYADPGDGSGTFHAVDGIGLTMHDDSSYSCAPEHYAWGTSGRISMLNDSTFRVTGDQGTPGTWLATLRKYDNILEIHYSCIEGCGSRFKRVNNE
jgi:hypothetical protein